MAFAHTKPLKSYLFVARWHSTALKFWVEAADEDHAIRKAERTVKRLEGGVWCQDLQLLKEVDRVSTQDR